MPSYDACIICNHIKRAFTRHGPYPQRLSDWSLGPQPSWGWFQYLHASSEPGFPPGPDTDWPATLTTLSGLKAPQEDTSQDHASAADSSDATREPDSTVHVHLSAERAATAMFVDSHNTGFYINSYTTKVNPGMDGVMDKLTAGLRRLFARWEDEAEETKTKADAVKDDAAPTGSPNAPPARALSRGAAATAARRENFRRTVQVLSQFESSFRRASWKSGSEMIFPMLFGHLAFVTHRCWTVFLRRAQFLAQESWRQAYGQLAIQGGLPDDSCEITYQLPDGREVKLRGWREGTRGDTLVYEGPDGQELSVEDFAQEAVCVAREQPTTGRIAGTAALRRLGHQMQEGCAEDPEIVEEADGSGTSERRGPGAKAVALSQLDDWLHRGEDPIVRDMCLYVCSIWVYRVEVRPYGKPAGAAPTSSALPRQIDIPFDDTYPSAASFVQRIASEP